MAVNFDWHEYFILAQELVNQTCGQSGIFASNEAKLRCAISRAYYALHCKTRNYLRDVEGDNNIPNDGRAHMYVINAFRNSRNRNRHTIGTNLNRLRRYRNEVDYRDYVRGLPSKAQTTLR
jgi:uncharacterized protein (UPF0332 family)